MRRELVIANLNPTHAWPLVEALEHYLQVESPYFGAGDRLDYNKGCVIYASERPADEVAIGNLRVVAGAFLQGWLAANPARQQ